jgi:hypothetical protein
MLVVLKPSVPAEFLEKMACLDTNGYPAERSIMQSKQSWTAELLQHISTCWCEVQQKDRIQNFFSTSSIFATHQARRTDRNSLRPSLKHRNPKTQE